MTARRQAAPGTLAKRARMRPSGPAWVALAVVAFHATVAAGIHLAYERGASVSPVEPTVAAAPPEPGADPGTSPARQRSPVPPAEAAASPPEELERTASDCVERALRASADADAEAALRLRGRWPAIKKAREQLRQRRIAARAACEQRGAL